MIFFWQQIAERVEVWFGIGRENEIEKGMNECNIENWHEKEAENGVSARQKYWHVKEAENGVKARQKYWHEKEAENGVNARQKNFMRKRQRME